MQLKRGDAIELTIHDLAFGGAGVGRIMREDREYVVFVEGTVPGDRVIARWTKIKSQFGEARLEKIVAPSPQRIAARCPHFGVCGGCSLQMLPYNAQLEWKQKMVEDALLRIGGFKDTAVEPIIGCSSPWYYRNKMEYSFGQDFGKDTLGLHPKNSFAHVFDLQECYLQSPESVAIVTAMREWTRKNELAAFDPRRGHHGGGILRSIYIREGKTTGERMINIVTAGRDFPQEESFKKLIAEKFPGVTSLYRTAVTIQKGFRTVVDEFHLAGKKTLTENLTVEYNGEPQTLTFHVLPQAFFQPNTLQAQLLYKTVLEFAAPGSNERVVDLFCGTGTIGMFFARSGAQVFGVELNASAVENARANAMHNNLMNIEFSCGDAFKVLAERNDVTPSIIVTDPPRAGIDAHTLEKIASLGAQKWVYVSCNPSTLARDLGIVCGGKTPQYQLEKVQPVDMFPHTFHVETVCRLTRIAST